LICCFFGVFMIKLVAPRNTVAAVPQALSLVHTKLQRRKLTRDLIPRRKLLDRFHAGLSHSSRTSVKLDKR
jgi:hypothetical protein